MSAPQLPPPPNPVMLPTLAAIVYAAAVAALWGILSLVLDREVVDYEDAGPLVGPGMAAAAAVVTWLVLLATRRSSRAWTGAALALLLSLGAMMLVAAVGYAPTAAVHFVLGPFVPGAAALSAVTVLVVRGFRPRRTI